MELAEFGDHLASCMRTVQRPANVLENIWMQIFEEARGKLVPNEKLRKMRIRVDQEDKRKVAFVAQMLNLGHLCSVMSYKMKSRILSAQ